MRGADVAEIPTVPREQQEAAAAAVAMVVQALYHRLPAETYEGVVNALAVADAARFPLRALVEALQLAPLAAGDVMDEVARRRLH